MEHVMSVFTLLNTHAFNYFYLYIDALVISTPLFHETVLVLFVC